MRRRALESSLEALAQALCERARHGLRAMAKLPQEMNRSKKTTALKLGAGFEEGSWPTLLTAALSDLPIVSGRRLECEVDCVPILCLLARERCDSAFDQVSSVLFALKQDDHDTTPLARLVNSATLCTPLVGAEPTDD